jgi:GTPase SAR1 family protein
LERFLYQGDGFLIVYSITRRSSFSDLADYREHILQLKESSLVPIVLVGNKCDLESEREVHLLVFLQSFDNFKLENLLPSSPSHHLKLYNNPLKPPGSEETEEFVLKSLGKTPTKVFLELLGT